MRIVIAILLLLLCGAACKKEGRKYEPTTTPTSPTAVIDAGTDASEAGDAGSPPATAEPDAAPVPAPTP